MIEMKAAVERISGSRVTTVRALAGGDISGASAVSLGDGRKLVAKRGPMVDREARMLDALRSAGAPVPEVAGVHGDVMAMAHVESGGRLEGKAWDSLAEILRTLRGIEGGSFGWDEDYALRDIIVENAPEDDWARFWARHRLLCHVPHLEPSLAHRVERLAERIGELLPARPPFALVHGDLWGGNVVVGPGGDVWLIDPCAYRGHGEVDAATLTVFDSPPDRFFDALDLDSGWQERQPIYRLWMWLIHVRLFGVSYRAAAERELSALGF